jgi:Ran GTPase-activating protein (RanGAP) involved in mRNA processing and transport
VGEGGERARRLLGLLVAPEGAGPPGETPAWPSACAKHAPRIGSLPDKRCRLAKDIARVLFPRESMRAYIETVRQDNPPRRPSPGSPARGRVRGPGGPDLDAQAKNLSYQRYAQARSLLISILAEADPARAREKMRQVRAPHLTEHESPERLMARPVPAPVAEPEPEPVVPCTAEQLDPLLAYLQTDAAVDAQRTFDKGTITTDGRLDLCKQVVGPEGIRPLLGAMMRSSRVKRLLLGNNVVGDGGAAAIAAFLRERGDSPLDCWYIAGNRITAEGIGPVCDALASDTRVKALWLKRNPLKAAGMAPLAALLRANRTLEVLDLVNCGLLDEGLATLLGALRGPGANQTLRHLYVGTNGVSARSAPLLAEYLAEDCALESLYLSCNRLGDEGAEAVARGLAANRTLRRLSLASNLVGPRGARALAAALAGHPRLELLDLGFTKATVAVGEYGNFLGDEGAAAMGHLLAHNAALRSLDLLHNFISQAGVNVIRDGLAANRTLVALQLTQFGKVHNEPGKEEIRAALRRNLALMPGGAEALAELELPAHVREIYSVYRTHM